jgi:hypothetical protein
VTNPILRAAHPAARRIDNRPPETTSATGCYLARRPAASALRNYRIVLDEQDEN